MNARQLYVGCAGWTLGREYGSEFETVGSHLERYARRLDAVEINSSFYRSHRPATYKRWASSVGSDFRFSVKMPKSITHECRLENCFDLLDSFLSECGELGGHLGCLLVQLPPSLVYDTRRTSPFFERLRARFSGHVVIEPRHPTWIEADRLLIEHKIARAAVDPPRMDVDSSPGGWPGLRYWRLHGSPKIYYSDYAQGWLEEKAAQIVSSAIEGSPTWCVFDNTAQGAALGNALLMQRLLNR